MIPIGRPNEQILGIGALLLLLAGCAAVLWPFLPAFLWAAVICFSTWPIYGWFERALGGRRGLTASLMTVLVTLVLVAPFAFVVAALAGDVAALVAATTRILEVGLPPPPLWVGEVPLVGEKLAVYWASLAYNAPALINELKKLVGPAGKFALAGGSVAAVGFIDLALTVFVAFLFYHHGRQMGGYVREVAERFAGPRGRRLIKVAGTTVKGVVYGLIGTALAQGVLAAIGFWIAGVPQALLLGFATFALSFVPVGPPLVWGAVALWLLSEGAVGWGIFVAAWGVLLVSSIDNVIRPYLLGRTSDLPMVLGFFGFIGGILAFGFIGLFLGPTLLAVGYSLFREWHDAEVDERENSTPPPDPA